MSEIEGTIQFAYELTKLTGPALTDEAFADLSAWRSVLYELELLGQNRNRYGGYAYGNLSVRESNSEQFIITASQTSGERNLNLQHLVKVTHCNLERFWVDAQGSEPPSSESLTHAMIYAADLRVRCVFHIHNPLIWQNRSALKLPQTAVDVGYGSPEMVRAVHTLMEENQSRPLIFATAGHEDGVFACGHSPRDCGTLLVGCLAKARALDIRTQTAEALAKTSQQPKP